MIRDYSSFKKTRYCATRGILTIRLILIYNQTVDTALLTFQRLKMNKFFLQIKRKFLCKQLESCYPYGYLVEVLMHAE